MAIVTNITRTLEVPHEPGCEFVLRTLTWKQLEAARKIQSERSREEAKAFGAEFIRALGSKDENDEQAAARARKRLKAFQYEVSQFDRESLLRAGIASWRGPGYDNLPVGEHIDGLDEPTSVWAAEQVIAHSRPKTEDETKNS